MGSLMPILKDFQLLGKVRSEKVLLFVTPFLFSIDIASQSQLFYFKSLFLSNK